ncbi:D-alanine--D-alanine ligase family protein [Corynebacterium sp. H78]|uniref:D-alanine--D-alanine ligase family protein n=1 Tax=Corynebacterium sp. H78 TaxID=3133417 RepID=UPI0030AA4A6B
MTSSEHVDSVETVTTVAVIYGGNSPEHSVSCVSAGAIMSHLDPRKYTVIPVGITRSGTWTVGTTDVESLKRQGRVMPQVPNGGIELQLSIDPARRGEIRYVSGPNAGEVYANVDIIFPVLHGPNGEDGTLQGMFELSGIPYVGPGVLASSAGMDKERTKNLLFAAGLPIGEQVVLHEGEELDDATKEAFGLPVFVKPARGGSSIGITRVADWAELPAAIDLAREHDWKVIVEKGLVGAEVECGVLQYPDGRVFASEPALLNGTEDSDEGFYGFDTKYLDDVVTAQIPAPLDADTLAAVKDISVRTFRAAGCDGLTRVDFFITEDGPVINEINTMPGFTPISMYPQMMAASDVAYEELLDTLLQRALVARR